MNNKIHFTIDDSYNDRISYIMKKSDFKHRVDVLKELINNYIDLSVEEEKILSNICEKTTYTKEKFFKEAIQKHLRDIVKKNEQLLKGKVYKADERLKIIVDEMIEFYKQNEQERMYINSNIILKYLKDYKKTSVNMSVIKRIITTYKPISDYHNEYNLNQFFNIDKALKKRLSKHD